MSFEDKVKAFLSMGMDMEQAVAAAGQPDAEGVLSAQYAGGQDREAGRMGQMAERQRQQQQSQAHPGLLGGGRQLNQPLPQGQAPHPGIQRPQQQGGMSAQDCAAMGGSVQGQSCVISITL